MNRTRALTLVLGVLVAGAVLGVSTRPAAGTAADQANHLRIRVLVFTMFNLEAAPWLQREHLARTVRVRGAFSPLHCDDRGLCVTVIGQGKSNAAASVTAVLQDSRLSLTDARFITAGIAGTPPAVGTLAFAAWARWVVDWDLGHHLLPSDAPDVPFGFVPCCDYGTNALRLDQQLVDLAFAVTRNVALADSATAQAARQQYPGQADKHPFTTRCDTIAGDDFFAGSFLSAEAQHVMDLRTNGQGLYCTTEQEDSAVAAALSRFGLLDRYVSLRTASNFDQPAPGQTTEQRLLSFPATAPAVENAYRVGSTFAHYLEAHPGQR